jgi:DNA-binding transcriptional LysR family regulator
VSGPLADLVSGFADAQDARPVWTIGSEEDLVDGLERGELDLAIGGMTEATPWSDRVSVTRGYRGLRDDDDAVVILLPLGENRLQAALEQYLDEQVPG